MRQSMKLLILIACLLPLASSAACRLEWDWSGDPITIEGFRFYQGDTAIGTAPATVRTIGCAEAGMTSGPGEITATAFRGMQESARSNQAVFDFAAPGLRVVVTAP